MTITSGVNVERLAQYLSSNLEGFQGPLKATKFSGGQSNPTFLIEAASGKYVLRRKPPGELLKSAHAVDREFRVVQALQNTSVPVAKVFLLCEDESILGSIFYLMEFIDGRVFWNPALPELQKTGRSEIYDEMNRVLAALHSVDIEAAGLTDYGRPGNYYARQICRWITQYRASEISQIPDMDRLIEWLPTNTPDDDGLISLVHGDFRLDNMMFSQEKNEILAVVDWELSTLGHPLADLAYQCMQWRMASDAEIAGLGGLDRSSLRIPTEEEYVAQYCKRMNIPLINNWNFYVAFSAFRFAAILQGVKKRATEGNASSVKAHRMGDLVAPLARMGIDLISNEIPN